MSREEPRRLRAVTPPDEPATLCRRGRDALDHGRLSDARALFLTAADAAARVSDRVSRAEAAIGAGGLWLYELRVVDDRAAYLALVRDALSGLGGLGGERLDLQLRLRVRLAAEATYDGSGTVDDVRAVVDDVRALGDPTALAESLSLLHHAMLTPRHAHERLDIANELVTVASTSHNQTLGLMGLLWRTVDLFLLGDPGAERALGDLRLRAGQHDFLVGRSVVAAIDTMLLIRAGNMAAAETAAAECHRLGQEAGDADADGWYLGHLLAIRWMQGRGGELLPVVDQVARGTLVVHAFAAYVWAGTALLACEAGELEAARAALDRVCAAGLDTLPESSVWLPALFGLAEAAARLDDATTARALDTLLTPYAALPLMGSLAVACFGSTARSLGLVRRAYGAIDRAVEDLESALVQDRRIGHLPMIAITTADLAETLLRRGRDGDAARADELLDTAFESGVALGLDARVATWRARRNRRELAVGTVVRRRDYWELRVGRELATVPDSTGVRYLAALLAHPGKDIAAVQLAGAVGGGSAQPVLDERARYDYQRRIAEIEQKLDAADRDADSERSARLRADMDELLEEVGRVVRPGGRSRTFVDSAERARTSVQKALRRALASITADSPTLGDHLSRSIHTGTTCRFDPIPGVPSRWDIS